MSEGERDENPPAHGVYGAPTEDGGMQEGPPDDDRGKEDEAKQTDTGGQATS